LYHYFSEAIDMLLHIKIDQSQVGDCVLCTEEMELNTPAVELPCGHLYHEGCIEPVLLEKASCPYGCDNDWLGESSIGYNAAPRDNAKCGYSDSLRFSVNFEQWMAQQCSLGEGEEDGTDG
jgi:Ring finger domain